MIGDYITSIVFFVGSMCFFWFLFYNGGHKIRRAFEPKSGFKIIRARYYEGCGSPYTLKIRDYARDGAEYSGDFKTAPSDTEIIASVKEVRAKEEKELGDQEKFRKSYEGRRFTE